MNTLDDLLSVWEERKESGDPITPEELCRNCPEMLEKVRWHIRALNQVDSQFGVTPAGLINSSTGVGDHTLSVHDRKFEVVSISNQYVIERHHASGGLGDVFLASDSCLKRRVAIKFPRASRMSDEQLARFEREARVTSRLDHPGIVSVHSLKQDTPSQLCYVMRFVEGPTLYERAVEIHAKSADSKSSNRYSSMEFRQLLNHYAALCKIVAYAHGQGVIHRDIKPNNVILGPFGETLLMDWGLARIDGDDELEELAGPSDNAQPNAIETKSGQILGTPAYASPEQLLGKKGQVDPRSDIFSLGATLHFLLTGKSPADAQNMHEHMERIKRQATTLATLGSEMPRPLVAICKCAAHPVQTQRYQSAIALADDIERYLANEQVSVLPDSLTTRSLRWMRKHPTATVASTLSMLLLRAPTLLTYAKTCLVPLNHFLKSCAIKNQAMRRSKQAGLKPFFA